MVLGFDKEINFWWWGMPEGGGRGRLCVTLLVAAPYRKAAGLYCCVHHISIHLYPYLFLKQVRFPSKFLVRPVLRHWHVGLRPLHMQVRQVLHPRLDHVNPYKLTYRKLYVPDTKLQHTRIQNSSISISISSLSLLFFIARNGSLIRQSES